MTTPRTSRAARMVAAACAVTLVATACGGDDDAPATTDVEEAPETTEPETTEPEPEPDTTEPETTEPEPEPDTTEPDSTEPDSTEPDSTDADPGPDETDTDTGPAGPNLLEVADEAGEFTILLSLIEAAGLDEELSQRDRTVLAPPDQAFETLGQEAIDTLLADEDALRAVVLDHVLPFPQSSSDLALFNNVLAVGGSSWDIDAGDPFRIGPAIVVTPDIEASNGTIHVIDTVLVAPDEPAEEPAPAD